MRLGWSVDSINEEKLHKTETGCLIDGNGVRRSCGGRGPCANRFVVMMC